MKKSTIFRGSFLVGLAQYLNPFRRNNLKVWGTNVASLPSKQDSLKELLDAKKPDVVLLNETWLKDETSFEHDHYTMIASDFTQKYQGTAILVKKNGMQFISCKQILHTTKNLTEIMQKIVYKSLWSFGYYLFQNCLRVDPENVVRLMSAYLPPANKDERNEVLTAMEESIQAFQKKNYRCIGYSDLNARLRAEIEDTDAEDRRLLKRLKDMELQVVYDPDPNSFTRSSQQSQSYIDYFFVSRQARLRKLELLPPVGISDHKILQVQIQLKRTFLWRFYMIAVCLAGGFLINEYYGKEVKEQVEKIRKFVLDQLIKIVDIDKVIENMKLTVNKVQSTIDTTASNNQVTTTPNYTRYKWIIWGLSMLSSLLLALFCLRFRF